MSLPFTRHSSSYRDPSGFLFYKDGILYRQVNKIFKEDFDQFITSGLYNDLTEKKNLIPHTIVNANLTATEDWYQTLQPEVIPFISYPYEWCFDMLKDAALVTLEVAKEAMKFGMMLKDASAYNVQWYQGKMMFIDTLSFEKYDERKPWIAYRQFCEHFFAPLALMHYLKIPLQDLLTAHPDGIPLSLAKKLSPFKSKFNLHTYLHLHLQALVVNKAEIKNRRTIPFSKQKMGNLLRSLEEGVRSFSLTKRSGVWSGYYEEAITREDYLPRKKEIILQWINNLPAETILDAGCNEGEFSELLEKKSNHIISIDFDHYSVNSFYKKIKEKVICNIHPLVIDLSNPSPSIGVNNEERNSFLQRSKTQVVLALALIHHLSIGKNIPFESIARMFHSIGKNIIIEFVNRDDEKIRIMFGQKGNIYDWYTKENFEKVFSAYFKITSTKEVSQQRFLYLMESHG